MTARYSFAVCIKCGVQSPPIILTGKTGMAAGAMAVLRHQGWQYQKFDFNILAVCPACLDGEKDQGETPDTAA
jgi:hypothetical protein